MQKSINPAKYPTLLAWILIFSISFLSVAQAEIYGLDTRPANSSCIAFDRPNVDASVDIEPVFSSLPLHLLPGSDNTVVTLIQPPNDPSFWYFSTRGGYIGRFENIPTVSNWEEVLDYRNEVIVPADGGLIQLIFHPDYPTDPRVFVNYSVDGAFDEPFDIIISSFETTDGGLTLDPSSETILIRQPRGAFHQGGFMAFDNNGLLYAGIADGTDQRDPSNHAQNLTDLRGNILRIDVNNSPDDKTYGIPADNPHAGNPHCTPLGNTAACPEIFAHGFRNPWRGDIDPLTGDIWVSDVGYTEKEETNKVQKGGNYGWNVFEGTLCREFSGSCTDTSLIEPVVEYSHTNGDCAVIGGYVYNGNAIAELQGRYLFADYCTSKVSAVQYDIDGNPFEEILLPGGTAGIGFINTFGKDDDGELYIVTDSEVYKIVNREGVPSSVPATLSQTGCFDATNPTTPASGLIPFEINSSLWSDGSSKRRWMALPDGATVDIDTDGGFLFPPGTVLIKEFSYNDTPHETRLFVHHLDNIWAGYSYEWREDGSDADLLPAGKVKTLPTGQIWSYPSRAECLSCHTSSANFSLGPEVAQLNREMLYPQTFRIANELQTLDHIGVFTAGLPAAIEALPAYAGLDQTHHSIHYRVRSYLHANCSACHRPGEATQAPMDFRFDTTMTNINACNVKPVFGDLGATGAKIIFPGNPDLSVTKLRDESRDPLIQMPPLGTAVVHQEWITLLSTWLSDTSICDVDIDSDLDKVLDKLDNCPATSNANQYDTDRNGIGDACELTANAGVNQFISDLFGNGTEPVSLDGSKSTSPMHSDVIDTWTWREDGIVIANGEIASTTLSIGIHTIELEIETTLGNTDTDTMLVTVGNSSGNFHPTANAGADQLVSKGVTVQLNGNKSSDPNGDTLTYLWTQTSGQSVAISDVTAVSPDFISPKGLAANEVLTFSLVVNDGMYDSTSDTITITTTLPGIPQNLTATAISDTHIYLNWNTSTAATNDTGYFVYRDGDLTTPIGTTTATSYTDTGADLPDGHLLANTLYNYRVSAYDGATPPNESTPSAPASDTTLATPLWLGSDVGSVAVNGSFSQLGESFTVNGSGADIWYGNDEFYFVYQNISGDGEIIAKVTSLTNTNAWAKAGVMIRESLSASSSHAMMIITPGNGTAFQARPTTSGNTVHTSGPSATAPYWVRLVREADLFTAYASSNGTTWTLVNTAYIPMTAEVYIGLAVTSHNDGTVASAGLEDVNIIGQRPDTTPPSIPQNLMASAISDTLINLDWDASADATGIAGYYIYRDGDLTTPIGTTTATSYTDTGADLPGGHLVANTLYTYRVSAYDGAMPPNESTPSPSVTVEIVQDGGCIIYTPKNKAPLMICW